MPKQKMLQNKIFKNKSTLLLQSTLNIVNTHSESRRLALQDIFDDINLPLLSSSWLQGSLPLQPGNLVALSTSSVRLSNC